MALTMDLDADANIMPATAHISHSSAIDLYPSSADALTSTLAASPHTFLQPPPSLYAASLVLAKGYLDPLAATISDVQSLRQQESRRKRKRGDKDPHAHKQTLQLRQLYFEGFQIEQIWEQARRILDASREEVERDLPSLLTDVEGDSDLEAAPHDQELNEKVLRFDEDGFEIDGADDETPDLDDAVEDGMSLSRSDEGSLDDEEAVAALGGIHGDEIEADGLDDGDNELLSHEQTEVFVPDPNGLNDGFFSIDDFNRQSEFLEQQDARGDLNDGAASDEEDIDWDADPMAMSFSTNAAPSKIRRHENEDSDDDDDGPTFGNADLNASSSDNGDDMEDVEPVDNTNDIAYADFFAPPPRVAPKATRKRALPKTQPTGLSNTGEDPEAIQRTISAVRRDLFDDDLSAGADSEAPSDLDPGAPKSRKSNHERRQAKLAEEIRALEAANVAKREWTLAGEARAADRPINSLLEEDLDFERAGKPVPVITNEVSEDIEALIKRRILAKEFDEVIRRRPDNLATGSNTRRGRFELDDTKPQQSLAEMYEAEHLQSIDPSGYVDKRDEKLKKEHAEIEVLWKDISSKLDALSNWHYKPKPAQASLTIVADVPTISIEDARPTAAGDIGGTSMLAPQEVYKAGEEKSKEDVVPKSGVPVAREEMTREEKLRRRRREKERIKKAGGVVVKGTAGKAAKEKSQVVSDLKKGGVKVIGKKGEIRDVDGKNIKAQQALKGAHHFKL